MKQTISLEEESADSRQIVAATGEPSTVLRWGRSWAWSLPRLGVALGLVVGAATASLFGPELGLFEVVMRSPLSLLVWGAAVALVLAALARMVVRPGLRPDFRQALRAELRRGT